MNYKNIIIPITGVIILIAVGAGLGFYVMPKLGKEYENDANKEVVVEEIENSAQEEVQSPTPKEDEVATAPSVVVVRGVIKNWISEEPLEGVEVSIGDKKVKTDIQGYFSADIESGKGNIINYFLSGYYTDGRMLPSEHLLSEGDSLQTIFLIPEGIVVYLKYLQDPGDGRSQITKSKYYGGDPGIMTGDFAYTGSLSPRFRKLIYSTINDYDKNLHIKMIDIRNPTDIKDLGSYSQESGFSANSVSAMKWSVDGGVAIWIVENPIGDLVDYLDVISGSVNRILNPSKGMKDDLFEEIYHLDISPNSEFIGIVGREEFQRYLFLYDTQKQSPTLTITEKDGVVGEEIFFDASNNFYYQMHNAPWFNNKDVWIRHNTRTGYQDIFENKPHFWDKLKESKLSLSKDKILYFCNNYRDGLCVAKNDGSDEKKIVSTNNKTIIGIDKFFWSPDSNYIFFTASSENGYKWYLWVTSSSGKGAPKIVAEI